LDSPSSTQSQVLAIRRDAKGYQSKK
jgi:hypothetical protein